jgi:hypothetical protein
MVQYVEEKTESGIELLEKKREGGETRARGRKDMCSSRAGEEYRLGRLFVLILKTWLPPIPVPEPVPGDGKRGERLRLSLLALC